MEILENLDKLEMNEDVQDRELPPFIALDETKEFAPPMEVQAAEIRDVFFDIPELKYEEWKELGIEEKVSALNGLEQRVSDIAMRPPMEVRGEDIKEGNVMGYFDGNTLTISERLLTDHSYEGYKETLDTLFHEGRHAYQDYNLAGNRVESNRNLVESWRVNQDILGYDNGDRLIFKDLGFYEYYTQPLEVDARVFAETVTNSIGI